MQQIITDPFFIMIKGEQIRRMRCYWGNDICPSYVNEDENQPFCNQHDVRERFCNSFDNNARLRWSYYPFEELSFAEHRSFRYKLLQIVLLY